MIPSLRTVTDGVWFQSCFGIWQRQTDREHPVIDQSCKVIGLPMLPDALLSWKRQPNPRSAGGFRGQVSALVKSIPARRVASWRMSARHSDVIRSSHSKMLA